MSDELEKMLEGLTPRGAPVELRGRILGAVAEELRPIAGLSAAPPVLSASERYFAPEQPPLQQKRVKPMLQRPWVIAALCLIALVPTYLLGNTVWILTTGDQLQNKLDAIKAAGDPVTLPDMERDPTKIKGNAAEPLQNARKDLDAMVKELNVITGSEDYMAGKLNEEDRKKLTALFDANSNVLKLVQEAGDGSTYYAQINYKAKPDDVLAAAGDDGMKFRGVINLLEARCRVQIAAGKQHEALQTCLLLFRLSRLYDGNLFIINNLVVCAGRGVAVRACDRVLRSGPVEEKDREALETELKLHDGLDGFATSLKKERAIGISYYAEMKNFLNRAMFDNDECVYLDLVQEQIDLTGKPYDDFVKACKNFKAAPKPMAPLSNQWLPAAEKFRQAVERTRGIVRCLRVLNALQRSGLKPENGVPKLADLKLPATVTMDPFTGEPLHVKIVGGDWLIYTVGPDLTDDGGDLANGKDFGVGQSAVEKK